MRSERIICITRDVYCAVDPAARVDYLTGHHTAVVHVVPPTGESYLVHADGRISKPDFEVTNNLYQTLPPTRREGPGAAPETSTTSRLVPATAEAA